MLKPGGAPTINPSVRSKCDLAIYYHYFFLSIIHISLFVFLCSWRWIHIYLFIFLCFWLWKKLIIHLSLKSIFHVFFVRISLFMEMDSYIFVHVSLFLVMEKANHPIVILGMIIINKNIIIISYFFIIIIIIVIILSYIYMYIYIYFLVMQKANHAAKLQI